MMNCKSYSNIKRRSEPFAAWWRCGQRDKLIILNTIQGDLTALRRLLETETDQNLDLIPQDCSDFNKPNVIELLRKAGAFVDNRFRETLLHVAVATKNIDTVKLLIEIGCDVNSYNDRSESVLHFAVDSGLDEIVELLVEKGANINEQRPKESALCCAVKINNVQLIKFLLDHGADVDDENDDGSSPFTYTADYSKHNRCKITNTSYLLMILMIVIRADLNRFDEHDLHRIVHSGCPLFLFFLHLRMIGQDFIDSTNLRKDAYNNIKNLMMKKKNMVNPIMANIFALHKALDVGEYRTIKFLIDSGAEDYLADDNYTALHYAIENSHYDVVKYLVDSGSDVNARDTNGITLLPLAVRLNRYQVCELLLARGANVNLMDIREWTPLYYATSDKKSTMVKLFLEYGAKVSSNCLSNDDDEIISNLLIEHVAKLVCLNTWDDEKVLETIAGNGRMKFYYEKCIEELEKMKICKVYEDICLFNILMDRDMTSRYARNEDIIEALDNAENQLNYDFPIYYLSSRKVFYEEVEKQRVVKGAATFLNGIFNFHDPFHLANRKILSYLSEEDINRINEIE